MHPKVNRLRKKGNKAGTYIWYFIVGVAACIILWFLPSVSWLKTQLWVGGQITLVTIVASFIGNLIEERNLNGFMQKLTLPITQKAQLPPIAASAILASFFSLVTANSMLVSAFEDGRLNKIQLRVTAMSTSFMTYLQHTLKIMYPTIAAIGIAGVWYFGLLLSSGFFVVIIALFVARFKGSKGECASVSIDDQKIILTDSWENSLRKVIKKTRKIAWRIMVVSIPMFMFFSFLSEIGVFTLSHEIIPIEGYEKYFPTQALAVVGSMMGGIISAATVAANFLKSGELSNPQVLLALLVGNIISLPVRTLRRSLPSAMSVFPAKEAMRIVLLNQGSRLLMCILLVIGLIYFMVG